MTQQDDITQRWLTIGEILAMERRSNMTDDEALRFGRAIETKILSKLRAPVADERAAFEKLVSQWNQPMDRAGWGYEDPKIQDAWWIWNMSRGTHPSDTRAALASAPVALTVAECHAITGLIAVARAAFKVADDAEDDGAAYQIKVLRTDADALSAALDTLDELPDDQPGYTMGPSNKAEWALRRLLCEASAPVADERVLTTEQRKEFIRRASFISDADHDTRTAFVDEIARAALASAPVADERASEQTAPGRQYHILKTDPEVFQAVLSGAKTFEIRLNDRGYAVGDVLGLRETRFTGAEMRAGAPLVYTGRECQRFVSHVLTGYGLADGWCCLSFKLPHAGGASAPVAGEAQGWSGWACQYPNKLPRLYGSKEIAQLNCDAANGDRVLFLSEHAAPQASAEDARNAALEEVAQLIDNSDFWIGPQEIRALKQPQAGKDGCTCPSGDGSLRHPCPMHPGADKDGGQQRARDVERLRRIAWLIGCIFVHGDFKAETFNERELEKLLRENGTFWDSLEQFDAALSAPQSEQGERDE